MTNRATKFAAFDLAAIAAEAVDARAFAITAVVTTVVLKTG